MTTKTHWQRLREQKDATTKRPFRVIWDCGGYVQDPRTRAFATLEAAEKALSEIPADDRHLVRISEIRNPKHP